MNLHKHKAKVSATVSHNLHSFTAENLQLLSGSTQLRSLSFGLGHFSRRTEFLKQPEKNQNERQCSLWSVSLQDGCGFFYLYVFVVGHSSLLFATFGDLKPVILHAICTTSETSTYHFACYLHHVGTSTYHFACYLHTCGPFACYLHTFGTSTCPFACYLQHFGTSTVCLGFV